MQAGARIMYVSRQLGHQDASITLRIYAHWLPDAERARRVWIGLDDAATKRHPRVTGGAFG